MLDNFQITGEVKICEDFHIKETDVFDPADFISILEGDLLGVMMRDYVSATDCATICKNFETYDGRYTRGADAPAIYAGTYHYHKELAQYFDEAEAANRTLPKLFDRAADPVARFRAGMQAALDARGRAFRSARWNNQDACQFVMRKWTDTGSFSLKPHDDEAQCKDPRQSEFEIQEALAENALCAINICLQNDEGGQLRIWNIRPDDATRARLGLETTGSPYPTELLADVPYVDIAIRPGDLYAFDGRYVHAVTQLGAGGGATRATLAFLLAHKGRDETIQWS